MSISQKRPDKIKYYQPQASEDESSGDFFQLLSFISGFVSIMFKVFCSFYSFINMEI